MDLRTECSRLQGRRRLIRVESSFLEMDKNQTVVDRLTPLLRDLLGQRFSGLFFRIQFPQELHSRSILLRIRNLQKLHSRFLQGPRNQNLWCVKGEYVKDLH